MQQKSNVIEGIQKKYRYLKKKMDQGKHSTIVQAQNYRTQERVAIKILSPEYFKDNKQKAEQLIKEEIKILSRCKNQNIIKYIEHFEEKKKIYLVLELADETLAKYVERVKPQEAECVEIMKQVGSGIFYLHQTAKAIHRDIRAQNIMIKGDIWKIIDLGFSKDLKSEGQLFTSAFGANEYTAPEILQNKPYTYKVDIWSLGVLLYAILYRKYPFTLLNAKQNLQKMKKQAIDFSAGASQAAIDFIKGCLKYNPNQRFNWSQIMNHALLKKSSILHIEDLSFLIFKRKEQQGDNTSLLSKKQFQQLYSENDREKYYNYIEVLNKILIIRNKINLYNLLFISPAQKFIYTFYNDQNRTKRRCLLLPLIQAAFYLKEIKDIDDGFYCKKYEIKQTVKNKDYKDQFILKSSIMSNQEVSQYFSIKQEKSKIHSNSQFYKQSKTILDQLNDTVNQKIVKYSEKKVTEIKKIDLDKYLQSINTIQQTLEKIKDKIKQPYDLKLFDRLIALIQDLKKKQNGGFLDSLATREDLRKFEERFKL